MLVECTSALVFVFIIYSTMFVAVSVKGYLERQR